jgi:hypothetical protein
MAERGVGDEARLGWCYRNPRSTPPTRTCSLAGARRGSPGTCSTKPCSAKFPQCALQLGSWATSRRRACGAHGAGTGLSRRPSDALSAPGLRSLGRPHRYFRGLPTLESATSPGPSQNAPSRAGPASSSRGLRRLILGVRYGSEGPARESAGRPEGDGPRDQRGDGGPKGAPPSTPNFRRPGDFPSCKPVEETCRGGPCVDPVNSGRKLCPDGARPVRCHLAGTRPQRRLPRVSPPVVLRRNGGIEAPSEKARARLSGCCAQVGVRLAW